MKIRATKRRCDRKYTLLAYRLCKKKQLFPIQTDTLLQNIIKIVNQKIFHYLLSVCPPSKWCSSRYQIIQLNSKACGMRPQCAFKYFKEKPTQGKGDQ